MKHTFLKTVIILFSILIVNKLNAQLVVNTGQTPTQYVQNVLVGGGVLVNNVTFVGSTSGPNWQIGDLAMEAHQILESTMVLLSLQVM